MGSVFSSATHADIKWEDFTDRKTLTVLGGSFVAALVAMSLIRKLFGPKLPPQPFTLPLLGNILQVAKRPIALHLTLKELEEEHGDIFMLSILGQQMIFLNTVELVKEVFLDHGDVTNSRMTTGYLIQKCTYGGKGVIWHGATWRESRRFALTALRDLGFGKKSIEGKILEEGQALVKGFGEQDGKAFDPTTFLHEATANVVFSIAFGSRYEYEDKSFRQMVDILNENMKSSTLFGIRIFFVELFKGYFPYPEYFRKMLENITKLEKFVADQIAEHKLSYDPENIRDLMDLYIQKEMAGQSNNPVYSKENVHMIVNDLLYTGTDTTATAMQWAFLYLITYPDIQKRLHQEIDEVVGNGRWPSLDDRSKMNYFHAFQLEVLRMGNIAPMTLPHLCNEDIEVGGYTIPKGALIQANIYCMHMSEEYWDEPTAFRPERFLDENGHILSKEGFMPFGTGPRKCLGENLAWSEFFLFMTMILQKFTIKGEDDVTKPNLEAKMGVTLSPLHEVVIRAVPC